MNLLDLKVGESATIKKIHASPDLKRRLISFGIIKGAAIELLATAPAKSTVEVRVGKMTIALRKAEAATIEVAR